MVRSTITLTITPKEITYDFGVDKWYFKCYIGNKLHVKEIKFDEGES